MYTHLHTSVSVHVCVVFVGKQLRRALFEALSAMLAVLEDEGGVFAVAVEGSDGDADGEWGEGRDMQGLHDGGSGSDGNRPSENGGSKGTNPSNPRPRRCRQCTTGLVVTDLSAPSHRPVQHHRSRKSPKVPSLFDLKDHVRVYVIARAAYFRTVKDQVILINRFMRRFHSTTESVLSSSLSSASSSSPLSSSSSSSSSSTPLALPLSIAASSWWHSLYHAWRYLSSLSVQAKYFQALMTPLQQFRTFARRETRCVH